MITQQMGPSGSFDNGMTGGGKGGLTGIPMNPGLAHPGFVPHGIPHPAFGGGVLPHGPCPHGGYFPHLPYGPGVYPGVPPAYHLLQDWFMQSMLKGNGGNPSFPNFGWSQERNEDGGRKKRGEKKEKRSEDQEPKKSGDQDGKGEKDNGGGGGPPSSSTPMDSSSSSSELESSVDTSAIRSMLKRRVKQTMERPKSSLGSVKIEEFYGERSRYTKWKKAVEAQQQLYRLDEEELAMLIYLSTRREARDCLDQRAITEYTRPGGLRLIWRILDESFGETEEELFERAEHEYALYRRLPGQSVAAYIGQMKRLKAQYARVDPDTHISDRAWAQKLLNRCSLSRRERLDVFFSAGGTYEPRAIERALRHRCSRTHEEERKIPAPGTSRMSRQPYKSRGDGKGSSKGRKGHKRSYVAGEGEEEEQPEDEEDLEAEEDAYKAYVMQPPANCDAIHEEMQPIQEIEEESDVEESEVEEDELLEAYAAGWKAKAKLGDKRKSRGWKTPSSSQSARGAPTLAQKKQMSTCASCGVQGHWKGDPQCINVKTGKDKQHVPKTKDGDGVNAVHFTFAVASKTLTKKVKTEKEERTTPPRAPEEPNSCPNCRWPTFQSARFCSQCGTPIKKDDRMSDTKRGWVNIESDDEGSVAVISSESSGRRKEDEKMRSYPLPKSLLKEAAGQESDDKAQEEMVKATPEEVLAALPQMSKEEKKKIKDMLIREEDDLAFRSLERHRILQEELLEEARRARAERASSSTGKEFQMPRRPKKEEKAEGEGQEEKSEKGSYAGMKQKGVPKKLKQKMLGEFRKELYDKQVQRGRLIPSSCAPTATEAQTQCRHPFDSLRWSANGDGHYASCKDCGLRHVLYFSERHGALMASQGELKEEEKTQQVFMTMTPGYAIVDSGCRTAVAGQDWHESFQQELRRRGMTWKTIEEHESFKFGSGKPETSVRAFIYPIGLHGSNDAVRISCVGGGAKDCPGLIGPSEMARWGVVMKFADKKLEIKGKPKPMQLTATRHPAINLMDYGPEAKTGQGFWEAAEIREVMKILEENPHAWAFYEKDGNDAEHTEHSGTDTGETTQDEDPSSEEDTHTDSKELWMKALQKLEQDLQVLPLLEAEQEQAEETDDREMVKSEDEESITSHEFGVEYGSDRESETDTEEEKTSTEEAPAHWTTRHFSKRERTEISQAVTGIQEAYETQSNEKPEKTEAYTARKWQKKKKGKWKVVEIFTWTCMVSMCALQTGNWTMMEPITLPNWDLLRESDRKEALECLEKEDPDLMVIAWPCTVWSPLQHFGNKTTEQIQALAERRTQQRQLLNFVYDACTQQRARGGAVVGENPKPSLAWTEEPIEKAFEGMGDTDTDMCQYGLRKPASEDHLGRPMPLKKRTRLRGTEEIIEECSRRCPNHHEHAPVLGSVKIQGKWKALSDFAGGYTKEFARCVIKGAEKYLREGRRRAVFEVEQELPEERLAPAEDEIEDEETEGKEEQQRDNKEVKKDQLMMIHRRLGHPSHETLMRMLRLAGAERWLIEAARELSCSTCGASSAPGRPMSQRSDMRPTVFNEHIAIDLKFMKDCMDQKYVALSMVDLATNYHQATLLKSRSPPHVAHKLIHKWINLFGIPARISLDQGGEWEAEFLLVMEEHAIDTQFSGSHAPWQLGHAERHGALLATAWIALIQEHQVQDRTGMKATLSCAVQAKNETVTRKGYSANALVFGRQSNFPSLLDDEAHTMTTLGQALSLDTEVARQAEMRAAAKRALLHQDAQEKLKKALTRRPGGQIREFLPGERVYFWVPGVKRVRYRRDPGVWRGPAIILVKESHEKYFVSWRGRCLLLAAANLKGATQEDNQLTEDGIQELRDLQGRWSEAGKKTYEDGSKETGEGQPEARKQGEWQVKGEARTTQNKRGRPRREAVQMMRRLKSVRKTLKNPLLGRRPRVPYRRQTKEKPEKEDSLNLEFTKEDTQVEQEDGGYTPTSPLDDGGQDEEDFWKEVQENEEAYNREEETRQRLRDKKRLLLDDVPQCLKRRREVEYVAPCPRVEKKLGQAFCRQLTVMVSDQDLQQKVRHKIHGMVQERLPQNQWLPRSEVRALTRILGVPVTAARLHRGPRKRLQKGDASKRRGRITVMLLETPGEVIIANEDSDQAKNNSQRKMGYLWRGMTLFTKEIPKEEREKEKVGEVYVGIEGEVYKIQTTHVDTWNQLRRQEAEREAYHQVLALKLKASGKELDPRWFNTEEAERFKESDKKKWEAWVKNGVIARLSKEEAATIPREAIFKAPLRIVRTNKSKDPTVLEAKSRIVVPGHLDPGLGEFRSDSPTTTPTAIRLIKTLCVTFRWAAWIFDVATAFLSGQNTSRLVYARAPPDGLPKTQEMSKVEPYELMRLVKSAYGLSEAPRLWYLRAVDLLTKIGMVEIPFCRSTFIAKNAKGEVFAICALHVDDGFLVGDDKTQEFKNLKSLIDKSFNIKAWEPVGEKGVTYLGMQVTYDRKTGAMVDDMTSYVEKIEPETASGASTDPLSPSHLTQYRRLIMRMRWPAQHVFPEFMFKISDMAQRVSTATYSDLSEANKLLAAMKSDCKAGLGKIKYFPIEGEFCFVSFFDAGLGKRKEGSAQQGEVHLITDSQVGNMERKANFVEFHSNKISRVVRSSMAAEACAMTSAADKQLYNRLLFDALRYGTLDVPQNWRERLRVSGLLVTDAKSLFDHCHKTGQLAQERQTALDMLMTKNMIEARVISLKWIPTFRQMADSLTKDMIDVLLRQFKRRHLLCLQCTGEDIALEEKRASIRRGQRERRAAGMKSSQHFPVPMWTAVISMHAWDFIIQHDIPMWNRVQADVSALCPKRLLLLKLIRRGCIPTYPTLCSQLSRWGFLIVASWLLRFRLVKQLVTSNNNNESLYNHTYIHVYICIYTYIYINTQGELYHTWGDPADIGQVWASTNAPQVEGCEGPWLGWPLFGGLTDKDKGHSSTKYPLVN